MGWGGGAEVMWREILRVGIELGGGGGAVAIRRGRDVERINDIQFPRDTFFVSISFVSDKCVHVPV